MILQCPFCEAENNLPAEKTGIAVTCSRCGQLIDTSRGAKPSETRSPQAGDEIGQYKLERFIGRGNLGEVFKARDQTLNHDVAFKFLRLPIFKDQSHATQEIIKKRFLQNALLLSEIKHPNLVAVLAVGSDLVRPYFIMEYLKGETMEAFLDRKPTLTLAEICQLGLRLSSVLRKAWERHHLIHANLRPGNIIFAGTGTIKILDLGFARIISREVAQAAAYRAGVKAGSTLYYAPEQHMNEPHLDPRTDIFALGMLLYRLITQRLPFTPGNESGLYAAKMQGPEFKIEVLAPQTPEKLADQIRKMLDPDRNKRPDSFADIETVLSEFAGESPLTHNTSRLENSTETAADKKEPGPERPIPSASAESVPEPPPDGSGKHRLTVPTDTLILAASGITPVPAEGELRISLAPAPTPIIPGPAQPTVFLPQMRQLLEQIKPGMTLDEYEIRDLIGIGGMGAVYRAFHVPTSRPVAIKILISDESRNFAYRLKMFRRESDNIARLAHASIVQVHQIKQINGITFVVMDLFLGPTGRSVNLMDYARFFGPASGLLEEDDLQQIFTALLNAVGYAHSRGVVHCDLKPENVLFQCVRSTQDGFWDAFLKVTDFGIAKIIGEEMVLRTARGSKETYGEEDDRPADAHALINTYDFMSPEQRHGKPASQVSDLFSIGIMMLRMLTGAKELGLPNRPNHPRPGIHPGWDKVIMTAMRENPRERYPDAASMAAAIAALKIRKV